MKTFVKVKRVGLIALFVAGVALFDTAVAHQDHAAIPADQIPAAVSAAVTAADRPDADKALDTGRQPEQMLAFYGVEPGMTVADLHAGGGYTTELLSRVVGPKGKVYSQEPIFPPEFKAIEDAWLARLQKPALANVIPVHQPMGAGKPFPAPDGSLDVVIVNMNYHDWALQKLDRDAINAQVFRALKPGGVYGIIDHSAKAGSRDESLQLHRIDEELVAHEVEKAGFKHPESSAALRHPADDRTWSTSPRVAGEKRGTSDRFMLKFVKP